MLEDQTQKDRAGGQGTGNPILPDQSPLNVSAHLSVVGTEEPAPVASENMVTASDLADMRADAQLDWLLRSPLRVLGDAIQSWSEAPTHFRGMVSFAAQVGGGVIGMGVGLVASGWQMVTLLNKAPSEFGVIYATLFLIGATLLGTSIGGKLGEVAANRIMGGPNSGPTDKK